MDYEKEYQPEQDREYTIELTDGRSIVRALVVLFLMGVIGFGALLGGAALLGNTAVARAAGGFIAGIGDSAASVFRDILAAVPDRKETKDDLASVNENPPIQGLVVTEEASSTEATTSSATGTGEGAPTSTPADAEVQLPPPKPQAQPEPVPAAPPVDVTQQSDAVSAPDAAEPPAEPAPPEPQPEPAPAAPAVVPEPPPAPEPAPPAGNTYQVTVVKSGVGDVVAQTDDYHISCGNACSYAYPAGSTITFAAYPEDDAEFLGWGGACSGIGTCGVLVTGPVTITASTGRIITQQEPEPDDPRRSSGGNGWVIVSEVMPGSKKNADDEFIELYNPTDHPIIVSGWRILKKNADGSETQLAPTSVFEGRVVPAKGHFLIGHSGSYQGSVPTDAMWPTRYTLRYSNDAIVLRDGVGTEVEEVHWAHVPVGRSWTRDSSDGQSFSVAVPTPQNSTGS